VKSAALQAMVRKSLASGKETELDSALQALEDYPATGMEEAEFKVRLALDDLAGARDLVEARLLADEGDIDLWTIYDLYLGLMENNQRPVDLNNSGFGQLEIIAAADGIGAPQAAAWMELLGVPFEEELLLPTKAKRAKPQSKQRAPATRPILAAYPNPSNGPVYVSYTVPEGVEQVELHVYDAQGSLVKQQRVAASSGILEMLTNELASGVHVASLHFDGIHVGTAKLNIVR